MNPLKFLGRYLNQYGRISSRASAVLFIVISLPALVACSNTLAVAESAAAATPINTLTISGSGSVVPILEAIQSDFEADTPNYRLEVLPGSGTGGGVKGLLQGVLDIAAMARPPKDEEIAQNVKYAGFGQAGNGILIHPEVGVTNLTSAQVTAIFSGQVTNWSEVGGPDLPIILYVRDEGDSSTDALRSFVMGDTPFPETMAQVITSQSDMFASVAGTPGSIGVGTWPAVLATGAKVNVVAIDGVAPGDPHYPMKNPLGIGYLANRQDDMQPLIDWLQSGKGQTALQKFDVIFSNP